jgi:hypothetical protein
MTSLFIIDSICMKGSNWPVYSPTSNEKFLVHQMNALADAVKGIPSRCQAKVLVYG